MAFLLVLVTFLAARAFSVLDNDTLFMPLVILWCPRWSSSFSMRCS